MDPRNGLFIWKHSFNIGKLINEFLLNLMNIRKLDNLKCDRFSVSVTPITYFLDRIVIYDKKRGSFIITLYKHVWLWWIPPKFSNAKAAPHHQKNMVIIWWSALSFFIPYNFFENNQSITVDVYCNQLKNKHTNLQERRPALAN